MNPKANYVRRQRALPEDQHVCHWPGCGLRVPPAKWGCAKHWFTLPLHIRNRIWATFKPGQEVSKTPSTAYIAAAKEAQEWIRGYLLRQNERDG